VVLFVDQKVHPKIFDSVQIAFIVGVVALFVLDLGIRLHWSPWGADERRLDLLANAYNQALTHETTTGYYNTAEMDPLRRLGASTLENSLFSRAIALKMLPKSQHAEAGDELEQVPKSDSAGGRELLRCWSDRNASGGSVRGHVATVAACPATANTRVSSSVVANAIAKSR
jgi:hypothetical protein